MVYHRLGLLQTLFNTGFVYRRFGLPQTWFITDLVSHKLGLSQTWLLMDLVYHRLALPQQTWFLTDLVYHTLGSDNLPVPLQPRQLVVDAVRDLLEVEGFGLAIQITSGVR